MAQAWRLSFLPPPRLSQIQYTKRDFIMARKCFAKAIEYNPKSLRALYGLLLVRELSTGN